MSQHNLLADTAKTNAMKQNRVIHGINRFMESAWFVALVCLMTVISNVLGAELIVYPLFILFGIYIALFGRDFLPIMSIVICCYIAPSVHNNPGRNENSIFYPENGGIVLVVCFVLFVIAAAIRLITDKELGGKRFFLHKRKLGLGMAILGCAYMLAGAFSGRYFENGYHNLLFALIQFFAIFAFYWFFCGAVKWEQVNSDYFAWVGLGVGLTVCAEIIGIFVTEQVIVNSKIQTSLIASGWGNANNIGCMVAMMIPFAIGLARSTKKIWLFCSLGVVMLLITCLTCSRTAIGAGVIIYILSMLPALRDKSQRKQILIFNALSLILFIGLFLIFKGYLDRLFAELRNRGLNPRMREIIYPEGLRTFLKNPIFGEGFYPSTDKIYEWSSLDRLKAFLPARWHNTVIQLLASCGTVGMLAYSFHRFQTVRIFWKQRKTQILFVGLSVAALLLMSLLDCHFFNIGPTLFYSMALAFAENACQEHNSEGVSQ